MNQRQAQRYACGLVGRWIFSAIGSADYGDELTEADQGRVTTALWGMIWEMNRRGRCDCLAELTEDKDD